VRTQTTAAGTPFTGLDAGFRTQIDLPMTPQRVELRLVSFARPARVTAFGPGGNVIWMTVMTAAQGTEETIAVPVPSVARVVIEAEQNETLVRMLCRT
jgi:hypothetical protein